MKPLFAPDDFPLKDASKLFNYEIHCKALQCINDKEVLIDGLRILLTEFHTDDINTLFTRELTYREITKTDNLDILKEISKYFIRLHLFQKEQITRKEKTIFYPEMNKSTRMHSNVHITKVINFINENDSNPPIL
jgi:hypothetical protein